ncbi:MAG: hypothetical protein AAFN10_01995 [Bacteroidota bacterium]
MDSWESDIRKKALAARPFEAQANWGKMEAMLDEPVAVKKALFLKGKQYWLVAAALLMLFGATSALTVWQAPSHELSAEQAIVRNCYDMSSPKENETSSVMHGLLAAEDNIVATEEAQAVASQGMELNPRIHTVAARQFDNNAPQSLAANTDNLYLAFANSAPNKAYHINRLPTPYTAREGNKLSVNTQVSQYQAEIKSSRVIKDLRIGLYLTQDKIRKTYDIGGVSGRITHIHAGFGLGLMKRIKQVWEAGIRLELSEMYYYVAQAEETYSDLAGMEFRGKLNLRRYLRKDVTKKIQPYVGLSSGISRASLDLYQVRYIEAPEPTEDPIARKSNDNLILPDGYVQYFSELEQLSLYEISVAHDANQYLRWENSLQLGTDIRLRPRLSLNFEIGAKVASMVGGRVMVLDVLDNQSFQVQQNIGLQYAF